MPADLLGLGTKKAGFSGGKLSTVTSSKRGAATSSHERGDTPKLEHSTVSGTTPPAWDKNSLVSSFIHILLFYKITSLWNFPGWWEMWIFNPFCFPLPCCSLLELPLSTLPTERFCCRLADLQNMFETQVSYYLYFLLIIWRRWISCCWLRWRLFCGCLWKNEHSAQGGVHPDF